MTVQPKNRTDAVLSPTWCIAATATCNDLMFRGGGPPGLLVEMEYQQTSPNRSRTNTRWLADSDMLLSIASHGYRPLSRRLDRCDHVIQNESRDPFGGNVYYVTMQITFLMRKYRKGERNLHCDVVHITTKWASSLTVDCNGVFAIKAYRHISNAERDCYMLGAAT